MFWWLQNWKETIALQTLITDHCKGFNLGLLNNSNPSDQGIRSFWWSKLSQKLCQSQVFQPWLFIFIDRNKIQQHFCNLQTISFPTSTNNKGFWSFFTKIFGFFRFWHTSSSKGRKKFCSALGRDKIGFLGSI